MTTCDTQQPADPSDEAADLLASLSLRPSAVAATNPPNASQTSEESPMALRVAGMEAELEALREIIGWPVKYAAEARRLGVTWPRGVLLHGPPGCGKTLLVQAVAEEVGAKLHILTASSVFGAYLGESERRLREAFLAAAEDAAAGQPVVLFLDEIDALCPRRDTSGAHEARVVAQLLTLLDGAAHPTALASSRPRPAPASTATPSRKPPPNAAPTTAAATSDPLRTSDGASTSGRAPGQQAARPAAHLAVVAATNRPNALDPALRRPGRLDREVTVSVPGPQQRAAILGLHTQGLQLAADVDLLSLAASCHGYSGADLAALAREAAMQSLSAAAGTFLARRHGPSGGTDELPEALVTERDFQEAMKKVGPSVVRGAEAEAGPVRWEDVGGLEGVKKRLRQAVEWPLQHPEAFQRLGLTAPRGVLLHGPPGCAKTTLARAAAASSGATLLPLSCAQLFSMYVGEGEAQLRDTFRKARLAAPAIVFLDEIDAVAGMREQGDRQGGGELGSRLLSTLLTEMDGMELATGVLVVAATNCPESLDAALLRPGRFDVLLFVPPPDAAGRLQALQVHAKGMPLATDVDLRALADRLQHYTGAELAGICREAAAAALREDLHGAVEVAGRHFEAAAAAVKPGLNAFSLAKYEAWGK